MPITANRIPSLDGLRALSILLVIIGHMHFAFLRLSIFGVHIFFVISGYLITTLLQTERRQNGSISIRAFYGRRCFRILPAAYVYILVIALLSPASRSGLLYAATYTVSYHSADIPILFQHLWSLSVEEQFYVLWPIALAVGFRYRALIAWSAMGAAALFRLIVALIPLQSTVAYMHFSFPGTLDSIAAGCLLAIYEPRIKQRFAWMAQAPAIAIALPFTAETLGGLWWGDSRVLVVRCLSVAWGVVPLLIALWIFLLVQRRDWIFNNPLACSIGVLSYSLYLWQQPFTVEYANHKFINFVLLVSCAMLSYALVERPMLKLGASLRAQRRLRIGVASVPLANIE